MTVRIAVHPLLFADEPAYAFFARWAFQLGYPTTRKFASAVGIDLRSILAGTANQRIAAMAGLRPDTFDAATVRAHGESACLGDVDFGIVGRGWKPDMRRYCLRCVAADRAAGSHAGYGHVHVRTWWDLSFVRGCPIHGVPLTLSRGLSTYVISADQRVQDTEWGDTLEAAADALPEANVEFERYFVGRLGFGPRTVMPLLDQFAVKDALWLVRLLDGRPGHDGAVNAFAALAEGMEAVDRLLTVQRRGNLVVREVEDCYRNGIYRWLDARRDHPGLAELRGALLRNARSHGLAQRFKTFLGEPQPEFCPLRARCVSISEVCRRTRIPPRDAMALQQAIGVVGTGAGVAAAVPCLPDDASVERMDVILRCLFSVGCDCREWGPSDIARLRDAILTVPPARPRNAPTVEPCRVDFRVLANLKEMPGGLRRARTSNDPRSVRSLPPDRRTETIRGLLEGRIVPFGKRMGTNRNLLDLCVVSNG